MMNLIEKVLASQSIMILDGALSTELERKGFDLNDSLWSARILMENPQAIADVHREYFAAGADCVITASYQATFEGFKSHGLSEAEAYALIQSSVLLAKEVRDDFRAKEIDEHKRPFPLVAASVGPYGAYLADGSEYRGDYGLSKDELMAFHRPRLEALIAAGPDILACETIPCLLEAMALSDLLKENPDIYAWISFSARDGAHICNGEPIERCAEILELNDQIAAIGINCCSPQYVETLITKIAQKSSKPIIVYPNGGQSYDPKVKIWHSLRKSDLDYANRSRLWQSKGAKVIGGCCKTGPDDIAKIASWVRG